MLRRAIVGTIKTCTIRRQSGKWYACFSVETETQPLPPSDETIGIDVGLKVFAALSNGEMIENPRFFRQDEAALAKAQRKQAKNRKRTKAYQRAKKVIARIHERIRNRRHDFRHQTARRIVNRYGVIAVEKLNVKNMSKAPAPKPDPDSRAEGALPGATGNEGRFLPNGAGAKAGLNKSILDASWSVFATLLTQKAESAARLVVAIHPAHTSHAHASHAHASHAHASHAHASHAHASHAHASQMRSGCGAIVKKSLSERTHRCLVCDLVPDRDTNAAVNIHAVGQYSLAHVGA